MTHFLKRKQNGYYKSRRLSKELSAMEIDTKKPDKDIIILVNGQEKIVDKGNISYEEVVSLAFAQYEDNPNIVYTILYFKGNSQKPKGELVKGETVKVRQGMIFNVTRTDRS